jgi:hypothetical protein
VTAHRGIKGHTHSRRKSCARQRWVVVRRGADGGAGTRGQVRDVGYGGKVDDGHGAAGLAFVTLSTNASLGKVENDSLLKICLKWSYLNGGTPPYKMDPN